MKILALDFDGIVSDANLEWFFVGYNSYLTLNPKTNLLKGERITFDNFCRITDKNKNILKEYRKLCCFESFARYFVLFFYIIDEKVKIKNKSEFDAYLDKFDKKKLNSLEKIFFEERKKLQSIDMERWYDLTKPFGEIVPGFKKLLQMENSFIVTNREKESLLRIGKRFGIDIDRKKIIDTEFGLNKAEKLRSLSERFNVPKKNIILVDDLFSHAMEVKKAGFSVFMATWGDSNKEQQKVAKENGILLLDKKDFYKRVSEEIKSHCNA